jgi:hypothetical protein
VSDEIAFGIGCFHFGVSRRPPFRFTIHDYIQDVRLALENVPTVNDVYIESMDKDQVITMEDGELPRLSEGDGIFPGLYHLEMQFDVYLPFRVQAELTDDYAPDETCSERFRVYMRYTYHGPVAFVQVLEPSHRPSPSAAVRVVREFLARELGDDRQPVIFESLGPSPFHADCYLNAVSQETNGERPVLDTTIRQQKGYDAIHFTLHPHEITETDELLETVIERLADELILYYAIETYRVRSMNEWEQLEELFDQLTRFSSQLSLGRRLVGLLGWSRQLNKLYSLLVQFEISQLFARRSLEREVRDLYKTEEPRYLRPYMDEAVKDLDVYPTAQVGRMADFLEKRRQKTLELFIVFLSALIGGIVGSLMTMMFHRGP